MAIAAKHSESRAGTAGGRMVESLRRLSHLPGRSWWSVVELIFPSRCVSCFAELAADARSPQDVQLCTDCVEEMNLFAGPACLQCGGPVPEAIAPAGDCVRCRGRKLWFDRTVALGPYAGRLRNLVLRMKQADGQSAAIALGQLMWQRFGTQLHNLQPEVVTAVPMHWRRRCIRGTNSAALLAEVLARRLKVPFLRRALRRRRDTPPQFTLPPSRKWANVRGAFGVRKQAVLRERRVLLVDDILTTGATCSEVAKTIKDSGAKAVIAVVASRTLVR